MNWENMTIGKRISAGFSVVLILLVVIAGANYFGGGQILINANEVIAGSTGEQARAIAQVNSAISHIDNVTQQNAATAEEAAAASEELSAQAEMMKSTVYDLMFMVGGDLSKVSKGESGGQRDSKIDRQMTYQPKVPELKAKLTHKVTKSTQPQVKKPKDVIPFDDDDFEDF